jgi:hypothetical protein
MDPTLRRMCKIDPGSSLSAVSDTARGNGGMMRGGKGCPSKLPARSLFFTAGDEYLSVSEGAAAPEDRMCAPRRKRPRGGEA